MSFGVMEAVLSFFRRQVGLRTDAADASGSLHAKVVELKNYIQSNYVPLRGSTAYYHTGGFASENTETTLFSVNGAGLAFMHEHVSAFGADIGTSYPDTELRIYVDGTLKQTISFGTVNAGATVSKTEVLPLFKFSSSFVIKGSVGDNPDVATGSVGVTFSYMLSCFVES